jgi:hypothetical protein
MRIIAAEVAITPQGQPEVEVGMLPLDLDLPGPCFGMTSHGSGWVKVRLTLHTSRGDLNIVGSVQLPHEKLPEDLGISDLLDPPSEHSRKQYLALLRSVERNGAAQT